MFPRILNALLLTVICPATFQTTAEEQTQYLKAYAQTPVEYVVSKFHEHRVVILGEAHWVRHDVNLVLQLIPRLKAVGANALAVEMFRVTDQELIDRVVTSDQWDAASAMKVMRTASWPYREYLEIIHAVWKANRNLRTGTEPLRIIAAGPGNDWRERLLPLGQTYDTFMAKTILDYVNKAGRRILVYAGGNHAFTRYYQPELPREKRVERFMDRMGNILWRELGEDVFMITLHRPWQCRSGEKWTRCLPLNGAVDCAAAPLSQPVGFDLKGSPFANLNISSEFYFALGYPGLRLGDVTDGYIWTAPIEEYKAVGLIPLSEFAPNDESLEFVAQHNPFSDKKGLRRAELEKLWAEESNRLIRFGESSGWQQLSNWRERCKK